MLITTTEEYKRAIERQGDFGRLFLEYTGCPRGAYGRMGQPGGASIPKYELLAKEVLAQPPIKDVDGGEWIPVHAEALREMVGEYKSQATETATALRELAARVGYVDEGTLAMWLYRAADELERRGPQEAGEGGG